MRNNIKINTGEQTNVRNNIIDFSPLDTESREDDKMSWDSLEYMGPDDREEMNYKPPVEISELAKKRIAKLQAKIAGKKTIDIFNMEAA